MSDLNIDVFISHRHADKEVADVINTHLQKWGIAERQIFQSSRPRQGLSPGDPLFFRAQRAIA